MNGLSESEEREQSNIEAVVPSVKFHRPRIGADKRRKTYFFTVSSLTDSRLGLVTYMVSYAARRRDRGTEFSGHGWMCTCPDFLFTREPKGEKCKHIRLIEGLVNHAGGLKKIPFGETIRGGE